MSLSFLYLLLITCCLLVSTTTPSYVPVYVMLPLDVITNDGQVRDINKLSYQLKLLKSSTSVDGIMTDVWWGLTEPSPQEYNFRPYRQIIDLVASLGLKVQIVTSFHKCGTNVGDKVKIPLPQWVRDNGRFYTDKEGFVNQEYLAWSSDNEPLFPSKGGSVFNRTAIDCYSDWMEAFVEEFRDEFTRGVIVTVEVGLGPAGEMRYPSYPLQEKSPGSGSIWRYPGIGEFQCYEANMLKDLQEAANAAGHPEWGHSGPADSGSYNDWPVNGGAPFFEDDGWNNYNTPYGHFFLNWYTGRLLRHGSQVLNRLGNILLPFSNTTIAAKVSGIHWWYDTESHAPELTAGYYNTIQHNGYLDVAQMMSNCTKPVEFQFTCLEMTTASQSDCTGRHEGCKSDPEALVYQTRNAAWKNGLRYSGENALPSYTYDKYSQILKQSRLGDQVISGFTYLRLGDALMQSDNLKRFGNFVSRMHNV